MSSNIDHENRTPDSRAGNALLIGRIAAASVILALSLILKLSPFFSLVLQIASAAVAGYDIFLQAVSLVEEREFFATPIVVGFVAVISFVIGFGKEGAALVILYQIGCLAIDYAQKRTRQTAKELLKYNDEASIKRIENILSQPDSEQLPIADVMEQSAGFVLKIAMAFALLFAILVPVFTNITFKESIHRALTIVLISTPGSVVAAMPVTGFVGLCRGAQLGVAFSNAAVFENVGSTGTVVLDKAGVLTDDCPQLVSMQSEMLDTDTFMMFAAHAVYYSDQPFAKAIGTAFKGDYKLDVINGFMEIPGCGVDLSIGGAHVTLATRELFISRGEAVPYETSDEGLTYYMMVSGKYVGKIVLTNDIFEEAEQLAHELKNAGITKCILVAEDSKEDLEALGHELGFDESYGQLDTAQKLQLIKELDERSGESITYVYSNGIEAHSAATTDIRVSDKGKYADALVAHSFLSNLPMAFKLAHRVKEVATANAVFVFALKAVLIFLSINGFCNLWFALFMDMAATAATVLNSFRVTKDSILDSIPKN